MQSDLRKTAARGRKVWLRHMTKKRYIRRKSCRAWQLFPLGAFAATRKISPRRHPSHHMKNGSREARDPFSIKDVLVIIVFSVLGIIFDLRGENYFLFISFGVTQVPEALATTIGSSKKSAAEALMSFLETTTFLASNFMCLEVLPILSISP